MPATPATPATPAGAPQAAQPADPTAPAPRRPDERALASIPLGRLVGVEARKMFDTRGGVILHVVILALVVVAACMMLVVDDAPTFGLLRQAAEYPLVVMLPVVAVLVGVAEWGHRSAMVTFTLEPRRWRVLLAKLVALTGMVVVYLAFAWAVAALLTAIKSGEWNAEAAPMAGNALVLWAETMSGYALGLIFANAALGIVTLFVVPTLLQLGALWGPTAKIVPWVSTGVAYEPLGQGFDLSAREWGQAATAFGVWVVLLGAIGFWLASRREAK